MSEFICQLHYKFAYYIVILVIYLIDGYYSYITKNVCNKNKFPFEI